MTDLVPPALPQPTPDDEFYWQGLREGRLLLRGCRNCGRAHFPPLPACPYCRRTDALEVRETSGRGRVYSWIVAHYPFYEDFADELPYIIGTIALEEGPRMYARVQGVDVDADLADLPVRIEFDRREHLTIPVFVPVAQ